MGDFQQDGVIATLHNLSTRPTAALEAELREFTRRRPLALVLPSLFSELEAPALKNIVEELKQADYVSEIVIGLDRANEEQYRFAREYFSELPQPHRILWNDGPRLRAVDAELQKDGLAPREMGKGRNVWYCFGYILAKQTADVVALHDCDIVTYKRDMLARLVYPVCHPGFGYLFSKGYYSRVANGGMNGRACRLLVGPLLTALKRVIGPHEYLEFLSSFRYPLAGEFAMRTMALSNLRIPSDWGLEIGVLSELRRNWTQRVLCQVDIADHYDHKHQPLSEEDPTGGLSRMSLDITKAIYRKLAADGTVFSNETFRSVKATYYRTALDLIDFYYDDAVMNGLHIDRHREEAAVELFAKNIFDAGQLFLEQPNAQPFIPGWNRVNSAKPDIMRQIIEAVEADSKMA